MCAFKWNFVEWTNFFGQFYARATNLLQKMKLNKKVATLHTHTHTLERTFFLYSIWDLMSENFTKLGPTRQNVTHL